MLKSTAAALGALLLGGCIAREYRTVEPGSVPMTEGDVIGMTRAGYSDSAIVRRIREQGIDRRPTADDVVKLRDHGVSDGVVTALLEAPVTTPRPPRERRVVVHDYTPALVVGAAAVTGYLLGRHFRHSRVRVGYHYCGCH